jgi:Ca2+-binding RTX toxin-like protein
MRRTATPVALVAAIVLALLSAGAVLAYQPFPGQATNGNDTLTGTSANENWVGSDGDDTIRGKGGDDLIGRSLSSDPGYFGKTYDPGADTYYGGPGKDILDGLGDNAVDKMYCGAGGEDLASFDKGSAISTQTKISDKVDKKTCERLYWGGDLADCAEKPWSNADVICKTGTKRADTLLGRDSADILIVDAMWGEGGNDTLRGRRGFDGLEGGAGQDVLYGGPGDDYLYGNWYGAPPQGVTPEENPDTVYGEAGDDRIDVRDGGSGDPGGVPDTISCGAGSDWAVIDIGIDTDPQGVPLESGQAGCESVAPHTSVKRWWGPGKRGGR